MATVTENDLLPEDEAAVPHVHLGEFFDDLGILAGLQMQLFNSDLENARKTAMVPLLIVLTSAGVGVAALAVFFLGLANVPIEAWGWSPVGAYLGIGGTLLLICGGITWWAVNRLREAARCFINSREELNQNFRWLHRVLKHSVGPQGWQRPVRKAK